MPYEWEEWAMRALIGIEPHEVRQVLEAKSRWPRLARSASGVEVVTIWGRTLTGRALIVAVYHIDGLNWKIVGSREMTVDEQAEFALWEDAR